MNIRFVIIEDNELFAEHALVYALEDKYQNVSFFKTPKEGIAYIRENLQENMIVLLDIQFSQNHISGHEILKEISEMSKLIPVILWSGVDENNEVFSDLINNGAFGFMSKAISNEEAFQIIDKAVLKLKTSLDNIIEDWIINKEEDKDKPIYITSAGKTYSLNEILKEIRLQTEIGRSFSQKLNSLTIDLLLRKKESING